jgi:hypothetical protein
MLLPLFALCYHKVADKTKVPPIILEEIGCYISSYKIIKLFLKTILLKKRPVELQLVSEATETWVNLKEVRYKHLYRLLRYSDWTYYRTMEFMHVYIKNKTKQIVFKI